MAALALGGFQLLAQEPAAPVAAAADRESLVATITAEEVQAHVDFLAGPSTRGRATLTPGFDLAAEYVEKHLREWELQPAGDEGTYRQAVNLRCAVPSPESQVTVWRGKEASKLQLGSDFMPWPGCGSKTVRGEVLFAGFAIDARKEKWRDLDDAEDKIVFAFTREPFADDPKSKRFDGIESTEYSEVPRKAREVAAAGGLALVLIPDPGVFPDEVGPVPDLLPMPMHPSMRANALRRFSGIPDIPVISLSRKAAGEIFGEDLDKYYESILKRKKPKELKGKRKLEVELTSRVEDAAIPTYNLAARIPGTSGDEQVVIVGAHLDHVGLNHFTDKGQMRVHPGADDNASGAASLLEIAQALAGTKPQSDILLLWFSGEENGLLGSRAYCDDPLYDHSKTIAMLNMDQIARTDAGEMNLGGLWDKRNWQKFSSKIGRSIDQDLKMDFKGGRELFQRSDHYPFHTAGVDVIFFFEGNIQDNPVYHKPGDTPDGIHAEKVMWIGRQVLATAWALAGEGERP